MKRVVITGAIGLVVLALHVATAAAQAAPAAQPAPSTPPVQATPPTPDPLPDMPTLAQALGVNCNYCHGPGGDLTPNPDGGRPRKEIALEMIAMVKDLNARIQTITGKAPTAATRIECLTCHRGVAIPKQLTDIITETVVKQGADAAVAQYRDLRTRYFGNQSYDFTDGGMINIAQRVIERRPDAAIALLQLNLEYNPKSARSYQAMAYAYQRKRDDESAIANLEKALELNPDNIMARGQLEQLKMYRRNK